MGYSLSASYSLLKPLSLHQAELDVYKRQLLRRFLRFLELGVFTHHDGYGVTIGYS